MVVVVVACNSAVSLWWSSHLQIYVAELIFMRRCYVLCTILTPAVMAQVVCHPFDPLQPFRVEVYRFLASHLNLITTAVSLQGISQHVFPLPVAKDRCSWCNSITGGYRRRRSSSSRRQSSDSNPSHLRKCARCRVARYCDLKCQHKHWRYAHKRQCAAAAAAALFCRTTSALARVPRCNWSNRLINKLIHFYLLLFLFRRHRLAEFDASAFPN